MTGIGRFVILCREMGDTLEFGVQMSCEDAVATPVPICAVPANLLAYDTDNALRVKLAALLLDMVTSSMNGQLAQTGGSCKPIGEG